MPISNTTGVASQNPTYGTTAPVVTPNDPATGTAHTAGATTTGGLAANPNVTGSAGTAATTNAGVTGENHGIGGVFAKVHGVGEAVRGVVNGKVAETFNDPEGLAKNEGVAQAGVNEMNTGKFATATKNREGVIPGDHERQY